VGNVGVAGINREVMVSKVMKKLISAVAVLSSLLILTACDAGVAAQVGDTKITQSTVQSKVAEILTERRKFDTSQMQVNVGEELNRSELRFLLISMIFEKIADDNGIKISQAMKDARKAEVYGNIGGIDNLSQALVGAQMPPSDFDIYIKTLLISDALIDKAKRAGVDEKNTGAAIQSLVKALTAKQGIKINPQYGTWDPSNADIVTFDAAGTAVKTLTA
jgi:hypothetical protein